MEIKNTFAFNLEFFSYLPELQELPVIVDVSHQVHLRVKVFLLMYDTQVVQAEVCHIHPETV